MASSGSPGTVDGASSSAPAAHGPPASELVQWLKLCSWHVASSPAASTPFTPGCPTQVHLVFSLSSDEAVLLGSQLMASSGSPGTVDGASSSAPAAHGPPDPELVQWLKETWPAKHEELAASLCSAGCGTVEGIMHATLQELIVHCGGNRTIGSLVRAWGRMKGMTQEQRDEEDREDKRKYAALHQSKKQAARAAMWRSVRSCILCGLLFKEQAPSDVRRPLMGPKAEV